jgi:hypothetical protein
MDLPSAASHRLHYILADSVDVGAKGGGRAPIVIGIGFSQCGEPAFDRALHGLHRPGANRRRLYESAFQPLGQPRILPGACVQDLRQPLGAEPDKGFAGHTWVGWSSVAHARLRLASRPLTKNCGFGRETVVLPMRAIIDEAVQRRRIAHQKSLSLPRLMRPTCKVRKTPRNLHRAQDEKCMLYQ